MKLLKNIKITIIAIILCSCSNLNYKEIDVREIDSREHNFRTEYKQNKWKYFMEQSDCEKVEFLDSVMRPILLKNIELKYDSNCWGENSFSDTLLCIDLSFDDFYYWIYREINSVTNHNPSVNVFFNERNPDGLVIYGTTPRYRYVDSLLLFNSDIEAWKDSLGCD